MKRDYWIAAVVLYALFLVVMCLIVGASAHHEQPVQLMRYEMKVFADGQVVVFDNATGTIREVRIPGGMPAPTAPPALPDPDPKTR